jgi:hypothetical protein
MTTPQPLACVYCGQVADTRDHVPPKALLRKPFPDNLITVPACARCNKEWGSNFDDKFRNLISLRVGDSSPNTKEFRQTHVNPGLVRRKGGKASKLIINRHPGYTLTSPAGMYYHHREIVRIDVSCHDPMIRRFVRGLHFYIYKQILPTPLLR